MSELVSTGGELRPLAKRQQEVLDAMLSGAANAIEIGERIKMDPRNVRKVMCSDHFKRHLHAAVWDRVAHLSGKALETVSTLLDAKSDYVRLEAAKDLLNRSGIVPVERKEVAVRGAVNVLIDLNP